MGSYRDVLPRILVVFAAFCLEACSAGTYCHYLHEDYYTYRTVYCDGGCCNNYGEADEICCFAWTVGIILGIAFACIGFIVMIIVAIICCHHMKKRNGHVVQPHQPYGGNNTVVYTTTTASAPQYPYPQFQAQPAYYPGTQQPGQQLPGYQGTAPPPPYTAGTQPAYMPPTQIQSNNGRNIANGGSGNRHAQTTNIASGDPAYPPTQSQLYSGYGAGQNGEQPKT